MDRPLTTSLQPHSLNNSHPYVSTGTLADRVAGAGVAQRSQGRLDTEPLAFSGIRVVQMKNGGSTGRVATKK